MDIHVAAPVADEKAAWNLLAALGRLAEWAPDVASSDAGPLQVGTVRLVRLEEPVFRKSVLRERVIMVRDRSFTYEIEGGIGPLRRIETTWRIADGQVIVDSHVELAWYARPMAKQAQRQWHVAIAELVEGFVQGVAEEPARRGLLR